MHIRTDIHECKMHRNTNSQPIILQYSAAQRKPGEQPDSQLTGGDSLPSSDSNEHPTHLVHQDICFFWIRTGNPTWSLKVAGSIWRSISFLFWACCLCHLPKTMCIYVCVCARASQLISSFATESIYYSSQCSLFILSSLNLYSLESEVKMLLCPYLHSKRRT